MSSTARQFRAYNSSVSPVKPQSANRYSSVRSSSPKPNNRNNPNNPHNNNNNNGKSQSSRRPDWDSRTVVDQQQINSIPLSITESASPDLHSTLLYDMYYGAPKTASTSTPRPHSSNQIRTISLTGMTPNIPISQRNRRKKGKYQGPNDPKYKEALAKQAQLSARLSNPFRGGAPLPFTYYAMNYGMNQQGYQLTENLTPEQLQQQEEQNAQLQFQQQQIQLQTQWAPAPFPPNTTTAIAPPPPSISPFAPQSIPSTKSRSKSARNRDHDMMSFPYTSPNHIPIPTETNSTPQPLRSPQRPISSPNNRAKSSNNNDNNNNKSSHQVQLESFDSNDIYTQPTYYHPHSTSSANSYPYVEAPPAPFHETKEQVPDPLLQPAQAWDIQSQQYFPGQSTIGLPPPPAPYIPRPPSRSRSPSPPRSIADPYPPGSVYDGWDTSLQDKYPSQNGKVYMTTKESLQSPGRGTSSAPPLALNAQLAHGFVKPIASPTSLIAHPNRPISSILNLSDPSVQLAHTVVWSLLQQSEQRTLSSTNPSAPSPRPSPFPQLPSNIKPPLVTSRLLDFHVSGERAHEIARLFDGLPCEIVARKLESRPMCGVCIYDLGPNKTAGFEFLAGITRQPRQEIWDELLQLPAMVVWYVYQAQAAEIASRLLTLGVNARVVAMPPPSPDYESMVKRKLFPFYSVHITNISRYDPAIVNAVKEVYSAKTMPSFLFEPSEEESEEEYRVQQLIRQLQEKDAHGLLPQTEFAATVSTKEWLELPLVPQIPWNRLTKKEQQIVVRKEISVITKEKQRLMKEKEALYEKMEKEHHDYQVRRRELEESQRKLEKEFLNFRNKVEETKMKVDQEKRELQQQREDLALSLEQMEEERKRLEAQTTLARLESTRLSVVSATNTQSQAAAKAELERLSAERERIAAERTTVIAKLTQQTHQLEEEKARLAADSFREREELEAQHLQLLAQQKEIRDKHEADLNEIQRQELEVRAEAAKLKDIEDAIRSKTLELDAREQKLAKKMEKLKAIKIKLQEENRRLKEEKTAFEQSRTPSRAFKDEQNKSSSKILSSDEDNNSKENSKIRTNDSGGAVDSNNTSDSALIASLTAERDKLAEEKLRYQFEAEQMTKKQAEMMAIWKQLKIEKQQYEEEMEKRNQELNNLKQEVQKLKLLEDEKREQSNQQNTDSYVNNTRSKSNLLASTNNLHANSAQPNSSKRHNKKASEDIASASSSNPPPATKPSSKSTHQRKISDGKLRTTGEYDMWYCQYLGLNTKQIKKDGPPPLVLLLDMSIKDAENPNLLGGHAPIIQVMQTRRNLATLVMDTEPGNAANYHYQPMLVSVEQLCNMDFDRPIMFRAAARSHEEGIEPRELIGEFQLSLAQVQSSLNKELPLVNPEKLKKNKNYKNSGLLIFHRAEFYVDTTNGIMQYPTMNVKNPSAPTYDHHTKCMLQFELTVRDIPIKKGGMFSGKPKFNLFFQFYRKNSNGEWNSHYAYKSEVQKLNNNIANFVGPRIPLYELCYDDCNRSILAVLYTEGTISGVDKIHEFEFSLFDVLGNEIKEFYIPVPEGGDKAQAPGKIILKGASIYSALSDLDNLCTNAEISKSAIKTDMDIGLRVAYQEQMKRFGVPIEDPVPKSTNNNNGDATPTTGTGSDGIESSKPSSATNSTKTAKKSIKK